MTLKTLIRGRAAGADVAVPAAVQLLRDRTTARNPERGPRLDMADCLGLLDSIHANIRAKYLPGALALLDSDADLCRRFRATEDRIDELACVANGPTEADFRAAVEAHTAIWCELIGRYRAHQEHQGEGADPMPELPIATEGAIGVSYSDGEPGTWDVTHSERRR